MGYLASRMSQEEILQEFPYLEPEDFTAVFDFFAKLSENISVLS
jgi:uncharacterized protein (DUF433 family)